MEPLLSHASLRLNTQVIRQLAPRPWVCRSCRIQHSLARSTRQTFTTSTSRRLQEKKPFETLTDNEKSYSQPAAEVSQNVPQVEQNHFDRIEQESKNKQMQSPWMREGSDKPPVQRMRSAGAMTKGKLLTTPSRMLKLILPLTTRDANDDRKDVEPLALLVHPQQPLSYLERLIQSEIPYLQDGDKERIPKVTFRAQDSMEEDIMSGTPAVEEIEKKAKKKQERSERKEAEKQPKEASESDPQNQNLSQAHPQTQPQSHTQDRNQDVDQEDRVNMDGMSEQAEKRTREKDDNNQMPPRGRNQSGPPPEDPQRPDFVRWSPSTEIGDFIRDAARAKEFAVDIEGAPESILVGVPSFNDRTFYLRMRLRKTSRRILELADIKRECDRLARRGAQRVAQGGFLALVGWWGLVYYLTFKTDYGWDVMEPVTYLVGLTGLMGGYMWFLYHNREVSYRSAMNLTISRRQSQLYAEKGFNLSQWEGLVEEANRLRREIKLVADEYDVEWDEVQDEHDEKVAQALREERKKEKGKNGKEEKEDKDDDDDDE